MANAHIDLLYSYEDFSIDALSKLYKVFKTKRVHAYKLGGAQYDWIIQVMLDIQDIQWVLLKFSIIWNSYYKMKYS